MGELRRKYGDWAIVAGSAKGLGEAFCYQLAQQRINIVMIDKLEDSMKDLSDNLKNRYQIETMLINADLTDENAVSNILKEIKSRNCRLLIYNAAVSFIKKFGDHQPDELDQIIQVNISSLLKLVHGFSSHLITQRVNGGILLMSSLSGLLGMQYIAPYGASKALTWNLAEALYHELKPYRIDITACIAGATATDAYLNTNPKYGFFKPQIQTPEQVANNALNKLGKRTLFISGYSNRISYFILTRLLPRRMTARFANRTMRSMYPDV